MRNGSNTGKLAFYMILVVLFIAGCSESTSVSQSSNQPTNESITIEGVTVSDTQITFHGKSTLPEETCVITELLADDAPISWWPSDTCSYSKQGEWEFKVSLEGNVLQTGTQYVLHAYPRGNQNISATFAFDLGGPPVPSE